MASVQTDAQLRGDSALKRGAWTEARDAFQAALREQETAEALEGLGASAPVARRCRRGVRVAGAAAALHQERGERAAAARWPCGWPGTAGRSAARTPWPTAGSSARRLLEGQPASAERAWLEVREGSALPARRRRPRARARDGGEGIRLAKEAGNLDLEMLGRAVQGLALVASGAVAEGMRGLDEVNTAIVAGELTDLVAIGLSCCYLISACERVRDYDRATQWCTRLKAFCAKWGLRPLFAVCRTQYASICMWRGTWNEAEQELQAASDELAASRPAMTGDALVRLGELRRRQGRLVEAAQLFDQAGSHGLAWLGRAELAFDRGDLRAAVEHASRYLRHVPTHNRPIASPASTWSSGHPPRSATGTRPKPPLPSSRISRRL
jgi:tetratricopeptide (TPR) repeat protein